MQQPLHTVSLRAGKARTFFLISARLSLWWQALSQIEGRQPRQTASAPQPNQMSVVFFFLTWREIEWGAEKISLRSFRQRRKVINTDSCRAKLESPTHNLILYFTARCRFYQNNTRARSDQNASEQIASAVSLLASWLDIGWTKSGQNVDPEVQLGSV